MQPKETVRLVEFDCVEAPIPDGTMAVPRPAARPRQILPYVSDPNSLLQSFDCDAVDLPPKTKAEPRPQGRERRDLSGTPSTSTSLPGVVSEVQMLSRLDKLRLIQFLVRELEQDEEKLIESGRS
jgi:hypothetical protein